MPGKRKKVTNLNLQEDELGPQKFSSWWANWKNWGRKFLIFCSGALVLIVAQKLIKVETINLSLVDLLAIILSVVSIVLAVMAIFLGKFSEELISRQNDLSVRLQNEIFTKTIETLARIQTSTSVTEKRVNDMVADRARDKAEVLYPLRQDEEKRRKLVELLRSPDISPSLTRATSMRSRYENFRKGVLTALRTLPKVSVIKSGSGSFGAKGPELVDGIYKVGRTKFSVSTFLVDYKELGENFGDYVLDVLRELSGGTFDHSFFVFDVLPAGDSSFLMAVKKAEKIARPDIVKKLHLVDGESGEIAKKVGKELLGWGIRG